MEPRDVREFFFKEEANQACGGAPHGLLFGSRVNGTDGSHVRVKKAKVMRCVPFQAGGGSARWQQDARVRVHGAHQDAPKGV